MIREITGAEFEAARAWLVRRGDQSVPTRLLAVRLGFRRIRKIGWVFGAAAVGALLGIAYACLQYLPNVRGVEMTESKSVYFVTGAVVVGGWLSIRAQERPLRRLPAPVGTRRPSWSQELGGWYLASLLITFGGGAALAAAMYFTTPAQTYAWSWLGALGWAALCTAVVLVGIWRAPVIAEDAASASADTMLRIEDSFLVLPGGFAPLVLIDLVTTHRQPPEFTWWLVAYAALAIATTVVSGIKHRYRLFTPNGRI
ncbi:hypothetical protein AB5J62_43715 [Amycolatopsis sp. cg5]|uniref:hypothetical protein n=1 Tax=Amycolatopsis sp. cg5 TaxID=3238802 RepID=UPI00352495DA